MDKPPPYTEGPRPSGQGLPPRLPGSSGSPPGESGRYPQSSGVPPSGEHEQWGAFTVGEGVGRRPDVAFQLAPRLYLMSRGGPAGEGQVPGELPRHLVFRPATRTVEERGRQTWTSEPEGPADWTWELVVERRDDAVLATLTATPPGDGGGGAGDGDGDGNGRLSWGTHGGWEPFGTNVLDPEPGRRGAAPLVVAAP